MPVQIQYATLRNPIDLVKPKPYPVYRANCSTAVNFRDGYFKLLPDRLRAVEIVCAALAWEMNIPAPSPLIGTLHNSVLKGDRWPLNESITSVQCFGTEEIRFAQKVTLSRNDMTEGSPLLRRLLKWQHVLRIAIFDELIANDDRRENLLLAPNGEIFIIDHARALCAADPLLFSGDQPAGDNWLLDLIRPQTESGKITKNDVLSACNAAETAATQLRIDDLPCVGGFASEIRQILDHRISILSGTVLDRLGLGELFVTRQQQGNNKSGLH